MALLTNLNILESAGLIRLAQLEPDLEYLFRHALVQDAAYALLLESDRRQLHQTVGEAIEQLYADRLEQNAAMLARHFERAGDQNRALHYFRLAARSALAAYANQEAELLCRRGLTLAQSADVRAELLAGLGAALNGLSRFEEALEVWREAIDRYRSLGRQEDMACLYAVSSRAAWLKGDTQAGLELAEMGMAELTGAPESTALAQLIHEVARACHFNGRPEQARVYCVRALDMAERLGALAVQADALVTLSILAHQTSDAAKAALEKAIALTDSAGLLSAGIRAHHDMGILSSSLFGDLAGARQHFARAVEMARSLGSARQELFSLVSMAEIDIRLGGLTAIAPTLPEIERLAACVPGQEAVQFELLIFRIDVLFTQDRLDEALALVESMLALAEPRRELQIVLSGLGVVIEAALERERRGEAVVWGPVEEALEGIVRLSELGFGRKFFTNCLRSHLYGRQGRLAEAHYWLAEAQADRDPATSFWDKGELLLAEADLAFVERRYDEALAKVEAVAAIWAQSGARRSWARILLIWAQAAQARGHPDDLKRAQALLREAIAALQDMGMTALAARAEEQLSAVRAAFFDRAIAHERTSRELVAAGHVQESLLPNVAPTLPGWQIAARLQSARETSGDFYDFVTLPDGRLGLVVADVADKGAGAALYMAVSRTYLRAAFRTEVGGPGGIVALANEQIVTETHSDVFVTVFCALLDPQTGRVVYANAGHNPPWVAHLDGTHTRLPRTGMVLGVQRESVWEERDIVLQPGDALVIYTDGVTDAQNEQGELFGEFHLAQALAGQIGLPARQLLANLSAAIAEFVGGTPQYDDMTLVVLTRQAT